MTTSIVYTIGLAASTLGVALCALELTRHHLRERRARRRRARRGGYITNRRDPR